MAQRYSIAEARLHLSKIVDEVEAGQEVQLTRRGKPVAVVLSVREFERLRRGHGSFGAAYEAFSKNMPSTRAAWKETLKHQFATEAGAASSVITSGNRFSVTRLTCSRVKSSMGLSV